MSIKVSGVGGDNLTAGESNQDFILNSHPVMMVGRTRTFLELLQAVEAGGAAEALFFVTHPRARRPSRWRRASTRRATSRFRTGARRRTCSAPAAPSSTACVPFRLTRRRCRIR